MVKKMYGYIAFLLLTLLLQSQDGFAFSVVRSYPVPNSHEKTRPDYMMGATFVQMTAKEFSEATGKNLNFFQRIYFRAVQHQVRRALKKDPQLLITRYYDPVREKFRFDALWFVIGSFIGPLGVLAAYSSRERKGGPTRKNKLWSVWLGFLFFFLWFGYIFIF